MVCVWREDLKNLVFSLEKHLKINTFNYGAFLWGFRLGCNKRLKNHASTRIKDGSYSSILGAKIRYNKVTTNLQLLKENLTPPI